jgi:hypothetical protein
MPKPSVSGYAARARPGKKTEGRDKTDQQKIMGILPILTKEEV